MSGGFTEAVLDAGLADWDAIRIAHGVAESGADFALSDVFPHDIMMDKTEGVDFKKGCYVGQEVVSRMQHRGTARRRVATVTAPTALAPSPATKALPLCEPTGSPTRLPRTLC